MPKLIGKPLTIAQFSYVHSNAKASSYVVMKSARVELKAATSQIVCYGKRQTGSTSSRVYY